MLARSAVLALLFARQRLFPFRHNSSDRVLSTTKKKGLPLSGSPSSLVFISSFAFAQLRKLGEVRRNFS
jgi:hypothetical protein